MGPVEFVSVMCLLVNWWHKEQELDGFLVLYAYSVHCLALDAVAVF